MQKFISKKQLKEQQNSCPSVPKIAITLLGSIFAATEYIYILNETNLWPGFSPALPEHRPPLHDLWFPIEKNENAMLQCFGISCLMQVGY